MVDKASLPKNVLDQCQREVDCMKVLRHPNIVRLHAAYNSPTHVRCL